MQHQKDSLLSFVSHWIEIKRQLHTKQAVMSNNTSFTRSRYKHIKLWQEKKSHLNLFNGIS